MALRGVELPGESVASTEVPRAPREEALASEQSVSLATGDKVRIVHSNVSHSNMSSWSSKKNTDFEKEM